MSFTVSARKNLRNRLERQVDVGIRAGLTVVGNRLALKIVEEMKRQRPDTIATGRTMRSVSPTRVFQEGRDLVIRIGPSTSYALWGIETGRAPGTPPPLAAIQRWVKEKPGGQGLSEQAQWAVARSVQRTISIHGTTPYKVVSTVGNNERDMISRILRLSVRAALLS